MSGNTIRIQQGSQMQLMVTCERYNPGQKSLGQYWNIHIFRSILGSLLKQCTLFEISYSSTFSHPMQSWNSEKILDTRVQHCL